MPTPYSRKSKRTPSLQLVQRKLRDAAPERNDSILQLLVGSVVDYAISVLVLDGAVKSPNAGAHRINGYYAQEIIGSNFRLFFTDADVRAGEPKRSLEIVRTSGRFETNAWRVRKDGTVCG